ncbi:MAG TPA: IS1595 family transposase [Vicinamibacterales bacterium]|nr:IS1595 family transposase [Vicinamibacterales bacterium]
MVKNTSPILSALRVAANSEADAVRFLEAQRWADAPACPRCGDANVYQMKNENGERNRDYRWRCRGCKQMFTVRTGTIFEESRLPLRVWVYAFWKACSSKKGISALQLSREMEITHKSALFVLRRIRHGLGHDATSPKLTGTVEIDETYVGGKPRYRHSGRIGRRTTKVPVVGMVQRDGQVRFQQMERLTINDLAKVLVENANLSCRVITDDFNMYHPLNQMFVGGHETVTHSKRSMSVRAPTFTATPSKACFRSSSEA